MAFHQIWITANPELRPYLAKSARARSAAHSAFWRAGARALAAAFRRVADSIARARRRRRNEAELSALSDRALRDIGLSRADIASVSRLAADDAAFRTVADLRRLEARNDAKAAARDAVPPTADERRRRPLPATVRRLGPPKARRAAAH